MFIVLENGPRNDGPIRVEFFKKCHEPTYPSVNVIKEEKTNNDDGILICLSLMSIETRPNKSFRHYAFRWMEKAAQIQPLLMEKEMIVKFIGTLQSPYYKKW